LKNHLLHGFDGPRGFPAGQATLLKMVPTRGRSVATPGRFFDEAWLGSG
jgi:hypothetical protein